MNKNYISLKWLENSSLVPFLCGNNLFEIQVQKENKSYISAGAMMVQEIYKQVN